MSPPPPHRILLTGANGYIATHILTQLLASPSRHSVRAVVRSQSKVSSLQSLFARIPSTRLDFAIVPDMTVAGAFDNALKADNGNFDIVMHTASPFLFSAAKTAGDFLEPAIKGTTEILNGIERVAKDSVKRVLVTSSFAAVGSFGLTDESNKIYTEEDWNPMTISIAEEAFDKGNKGPAYLVSKTLAERAAWDFHSKLESKSWDLVTLCPPMVYGPIAYHVNSMEELGESVAQVYNGYLNKKTPSDDLPPQPIPLYVDVRDLALAHVRAMDAPEAANQRFGICSGDIRNQEVADLLRKEVPGVDKRVPSGEPGKDMRPVDAFSQDSSKAEKVLGLGWRSKEETFGDMGRQFVELESQVRVGKAAI
jgi:nucleoside-diphosphate-sugar epimerase